MDDIGFGEDDDQTKDNKGDDKEKKKSAADEKDTKGNLDATEKSGTTPAVNGKQAVNLAAVVLEDVQEEGEQLQMDEKTASLDSQWATVPGSPMPSPSVGDQGTDDAVPSTPEVAKLAAVPEATMGSSVSYRSKRRAGSTAGDSLERASKLKASRNLGGELLAGNNVHCPTLCFSVNHIVDRLKPLGFLVDNQDTSINKFVDFIANLQLKKPEVESKQDMLAWALEKEEKQRIEEEELDNFILSTLCNDILEDVIDTNSEHIIMSRTDRSAVTERSHGKKLNKTSVPK